MGLELKVAVFSMNGGEWEPCPLLAIAAWLPLSLTIVLLMPGHTEPVSPDGWL